MAKSKAKGGDQLPMGFMLPETDWVTPSELPDLRQYGEFLGIDTETKDDGLATNMGAGWVYGAGYIAGVSMAAGDRKVYVPLRHPDSEVFDHDAVRRWIQDHFNGPQRKVFHNGPYDLGWFRREFGILPPDLLDDTMGMAFILDENQFEYGLDAVCKREGIQGKNEELLRMAADAYGVDPKSQMWKLPSRFVGPYAEDDAFATMKLAQKLIPKLEAQRVDEAYRLEMDIMPLCVEMRLRGIRMDEDEMERGKIVLTQKRDEALARLTDLVPIGRDWSIKDIASPRFMAATFTDLGIPFPQTAKGNDSFSNEWMSKSEHEVPQLCARASQMHDSSDKFIDKYLKKFTHMGRIHAEPHQFKDGRGGTVTTRFSYSAPPLQQMPSRNPEIAAIIRNSFLAEHGELWGALDYSQQEYRLMVHYASVCNMAGVESAVDAYTNDPNTDFHDMVAKLTGLPRRKAKDVNFAKSYGAGVPKFAEMTGMSEEEARATMAQYDDEMPFIKRLGEFCQSRADHKGFIRMLDGARGRFPFWEPRWTDWKRVKEFNQRAIEEGRPLPKLTMCSREEAMARVRDPDHPWTGRLRRAMTHKAMNKLIQGSAARTTKMAMRECWRQKIVPMLQMHDELDFSFGDQKSAIIAEEIMREICELRVPMKVDAEFGLTWGQAKETWDEAYQKLAA